MEKKWVCEEHGFGTDGPKHWGIHVKEHHDGVDPRKPVKKLSKPIGAVAVSKAVGLLRDEKERLEHSISRLKQDVERMASAIKILETPE